MPNMEYFGFPEPAPGQRGPGKSFYATHYYLYPAREDPAGIPLLDQNGIALGPKVSKRDWCKGALEGSIVVENAAGEKTVYTYASKPDGPDALQVDCRDITPTNAEGRIRYKIARGPFGEGVDHDNDGVKMLLVPYRSIALRPQLNGIPYRSVVYVPNARGLRIALPSGGTAVHDGYFFVADTGSGLVKGQIDVFGGARTQSPFPSFVSVTPRKFFSLFVINDPEISATLALMHDEL